MAPPLAIAPIASAAVFGLVSSNWSTAQVAAITAIAVLVLVGWPLIFLMLDNGRQGPVTRTVVGLACGAAPFAAAVVSGVVGLYARSSDLGYVRWVLGYGASVPYFGTVPWPRFAWLLTLGMVSGVVTMWMGAVVAAAATRDRRLTPNAPTLP